MMSRRYGNIAMVCMAYEGVRTAYKLSASPRMSSRRALDYRSYPCLYEEYKMYRDETRPFLVSSEVIPSLFISVTGSLVLAPFHVYNDSRRAEMKLRGIEPETELQTKTRDAVYGSLFDFVVE